MFKTWLVTVAILAALLAGWLAVQAAARRFAARHPQFGAYREGCGCGGSCGREGAGDGGCGVNERVSASRNSPE